MYCKLYHVFTFHYPLNLKISQWDIWKYDTFFMVSTNLRLLLLYLLVSSYLRSRLVYYCNQSTKYRNYRPPFPPTIFGTIIHPHFIIYFVPTIVTIHYFQLYAYYYNITITIHRWYTATHKTEKIIFLILLVLLYHKK